MPDQSHIICITAILRRALRICERRWRVARKSCARCVVGYPGYVSRNSWSIFPAVTARSPAGPNYLSVEKSFSADREQSAETRYRIVDYCGDVHLYPPGSVTAFQGAWNSRAERRKTENADAKTIGDCHNSAADDRTGGDCANRRKRAEPLPAPVGHRQPRADQVPEGKDNSAAAEAEKRQDAELDRKIKSICRGC